MSGISVFRVIRVIRRSERAGKIGGQLAAGENARGLNLFSVLSLGRLAFLALAQPELLALIIPIIAYSAISTYLAGTPEEQHDRLLQQIFGRAEGIRISQLQWSHRQTEIDLRSKVP